MTAGDEHGSGSQQSHADPPSYRLPGPGQPGYGHVSVPQPPRRRLAAIISYVAVAAVAACGGGLAVALTSASGSPPSASTGLRPGSGAGTEPGAGAPTGASITGATLQRVENAVQPGLVVINSRLQDDGADVSGAAGTGMIISRSGLVLTNNHVIDATNGLTATVVSTGKTYPAMWLGYDKGSDIAVIKLEGASGLTPVPPALSACSCRARPMAAGALRPARGCNCSRWRNPNSSRVSARVAAPIRDRTAACPTRQTRESPATSRPPRPGRSCSARSARARPRRRA